MKFFKILIIVSFCIGSCWAQKQDRIWIFADSAGIDFNDTSNITVFNSTLSLSAGASFATIADSFGNLLFYAAGVELAINYGGKIYNRNMEIMLNGDSIAAYPGVGQGCLIIPFPGNNSKYYLFTIDRHGNGYSYPFYSVIDMSLDSGRGGVISKNNILTPEIVNEKMTAVKHANGRDWWVILQANATDEFIKFLVTPDSLIGPLHQTIGSTSNNNKSFGQMIFSKDGNKLGLVGSGAYVDIFDFDRCTGDLSNYINAGEQVFTQQNRYFGCSFSPNGNVFYSSSIWYEYKNVYQYDLTASDVFLSKQTIFSYPDTGLIQYVQLGQHMLGPDGKIYVAKGNGYGGINSDTYYTHHIDAITNPNQIGPLCNYQPNYLDLGVGRTIQGLPNMVNYNLGPVLGSICDSLHIGINEINYDKYFTVYPNPVKDRLNVSITTKETFTIIVTDLLGKTQIKRKMLIGENTINLEALLPGVYTVTLQSEKLRMSKRVVKL